MKRVISLFLFLTLLFPIICFAAWTDDFRDTFMKVGLDQAVEDALEGDIKPQAILDFIISEEQLNPRSGLKALYCAGVDRADVAAAAAKLGITPHDLQKALEESIAECSSKLVLDDRDNSGVIASPSKP